MGISKFNSEGYYDPTPHEALSNIKKEERAWKPLVYVASPFAGDEARNTENAIRYCRFAVDSGAIPLAPHIFLPRFMSEARERDKAMFMNMVFLGKCEQLWVFGVGSRTAWRRRSPRRRNGGYLSAISRTAAGNCQAARLKARKIMEEIR